MEKTLADNTKIYKIQDSQSGKIYEIEGPEGATDEELYSFLEQDLSANAPQDAVAAKVDQPKRGSAYIEQAPVVPVEDSTQWETKVGHGGNASDNDWMSQDEKNQYLELVNNQTIPFDDIQKWVNTLAVSKGFGGAPTVSTPEQLAAYRDQVKKTGKTGSFSYAPWTAGIEKPTATVGDGDGGFDLDF